VSFDPKYWAFCFLLWIGEHQHYHRQLAGMAAKPTFAPSFSRHHRMTHRIK
jgi:hypothetical protein